MKKKIVITWVLVIAFVFCTVPVFAQQKLSNISAKTLEREFFNLEDWNDDAQKYAAASGKKMTMNRVGLNTLVNGVYVETGKDGVAYIYGWTPQSFTNIPKQQIFIKVGPNSRVDVTVNKKEETTVLTLTKGSWQQDNGAKELAKFDELMTFFSCAESEKIANQVANWKKSGNRTKDQLADYVISQKSTKTGFLGGIAGIGGAISIPNQFLSVFADWCVQAEMAYAIACVYRDKPPSQTELKKDLYMLLCDTDVRSEALKSHKIDPKIELTKIVVNEIAGATMEKLMKEIAAKQTNKLASKAAAGGVKAIPVVSSFIGARGNFSGAKTFGEKAKNYYSK